MLPGTQVNANDVYTILGEGNLNQEYMEYNDTPYTETSPISRVGGDIKSDTFYQVASQYAHVFFQSEYPNKQQQYHGRVYNHFITQVEKSLIQMALNYCQGNQIKASELLGINRNTLRKRIQVLDIDVIRKSKV